MKKLITYIAIFLLLLVPAGVDAESGNPLTVDFDPNPLFSEGGNFLPGDTASGEITAKNNTKTDQDLYIRFLENSQSNNLGDAIVISVSESGGSDVEEQNINDWFSDGRVSLGKLSGGESASFDLFALFEEQSGNEYQNGHVDFDVCVGLTSGDVVCMDDSNGDDEGGGEEIVTDDPPRRSQFSDDFDDGGDNGDDEEDPERDPDSEDETPPGSEFGQGGDNPPLPGGGSRNNLALIETGDGEASGEGEVEEEEEETREVPDEEGTRQAAAAFLGLPEGVADFLECASLFLLILIIIALLTIGYDAWRDAPSLPDRARVQNRIIFVDVLLVIALILAIIIPLPCVIIPLIITIILGIIWFVVEDRRLKHGSRF
ncbi:MAG: hypothetical protein U5L75_02840 [Candidatus Campbellbacteria bacterium]|nr:hypothetical protein [Candidatus Campbellbacteria bacterium]